MFSLSPDAVIQRLQHGAEQETIVIIETALAAPEALVDDAAARAFHPIGPHYPGIRAALSSALRDAVVNALRRFIATLYRVESRDWEAECYYSLVTTPPERLAPIQRFPHFDGCEEDRFAALLFLCPETFGGTSFYRHRSTGFETVGASRFEAYKTSLEADVKRFGLPHPSYIDEGGPMFERIARYDAAMNRMLIYRGKALHCSAVAAPARLSPDPRRGRLTLNVFLSPRRSAQ